MLFLPGEFVHKEANSETAAEKAERRDHNDEGYFAYTRSHQILEEKFVILIFYCLKTITKNITNQIRTVSNVSVGFLCVFNWVSGPRPKEGKPKKYFSRTPIFY
jgi:hypothetical protein